ncbi:MAG: TetR family transcriptional regulator C-terminal domain-containing protein [Atopobiaceae bacterium]|nr:TetR family transcriptional regulator C-terminal domain-containing protein [Atopobiaceae bacterium]
MLADEDSRNLALVFYSHGIFRVIREWIKCDIKKTPEDVAEILYRILFENQRLAEGSVGACHEAAD